MEIDNDHRIAVVKAWREARAHGEDQASFCARQVPPIKPRTLRLWVKTIGAEAGATTAGSDLDLIWAALSNMQLLADLLERNRLSGMPRGAKANEPTQAPHENLETEEPTTAGAAAIEAPQRYDGMPTGADQHEPLLEGDEGHLDQAHGRHAAERHGGIATESAATKASRFWDDP